DVLLICHESQLLSFPTRRSSDLIRPRHHEDAGHGAEGGGGAVGSGTGHGRVGCALGESGAASPGPHRGHGGTRRVHPTTPRRLRDRKSTRLNSSHVSISYAVFCL